jgi:hypothetical protein
MMLFAGCGGSKGTKAIVKFLPSQIEQAIQNAGPFNVDVELIRKGKAYDVKVNLVNITTGDLAWSKYPPDERVVYFAVVCIVPVGLIAIEHEESVEFRNLVIGYKGEEWVLSMDECAYFTSNIVSGNLNEKDLFGELLAKLRKVD